MIWTKAPATGMPIGSDSWNMTGTDLNGGGFVQNSDTHNRTYEFTWGAAPLKEIYEITDYATGAYGEGPLYFLDPFAMQTNLFNDAFSAPYKLVRSGLMYGNVADTVTNVPNIFSNSNFDTPASSDQTVMTNLALNPSFEAAGSTVEVRRNLHTNPDLQVNASGWGEPFGVESARLTDPGNPEVPSGYALRVFSTSGVSSASSVYLSEAIPVTAGQVITISFWTVTNVASLPFTPRVMWGGGTYWAVPTFTATSSYSMCSFTVTVPAGETTMRIRPLFPNGLTSTQALRFRRALVEVSPQVRPYLDGSYSPDPEFTPSWVGTVGLSASVLTATRAARALPSGTGTHAYQSTDWSASGTKSVRIDGAQASGKPECIVADHTPSYMTQLQAGKTYTAAAWLRLTGAGTQILDSQRKMNFYWSNNSGSSYTEVKSEEAENGPGESLIRFTFTVPSNATNAILRLGGNGIGHQAWWDDFTIVEGKHPWIMPFHGDLTPDEDMYTLWTGTENASTSTLNARTPAGIPAYSATQRLTIQTTENTDLRIIRTDNATQASYGTHPVQFSSGSVGKTFTAFARVRIPQGYDPTDDVALNDSRSRSLYLFGSADTYYAQAPAVPGTYDLKITFTVPVSGATVRLGGGGAIGQSVYYESFYLFEGEVDFFDPRNMPRQMATDIDGLTQPHYIPVPKGYTLWVAYGANAVAMVANGAQQLDPYTWYSFTTGTDFAWTGISSGTSAVGAIAIMTKNGEQRPEIEWSPGKGNSGLRFVGKPNIQGISAKLRDGLVSGSAQLREVGLWEQ